jgi:hypothetical protein
MSRIKIFENTVHPKFKNILIKQAEFKEKECFNDLLKHKNPETNRINVTQNNISEINANLELLMLHADSSTFNVVSIIKNIFPEYTKESSSSAINFLIQNLDVEEINFANIQGAEQLAGIVNLQNLTNTFMVKSANTYLENKFKDIDIASVFSKGEAGLT